MSVQIAKTRLKGGDTEIEISRDIGDKHTERAIIVTLPANAAGEMSICWCGVLRAGSIEQDSGTIAIAWGHAGLLIGGHTIEDEAPVMAPPDVSTTGGAITDAIRRKTAEAANGGDRLFTADIRGKADLTGVSVFDFTLWGDVEAPRGNALPEVGIRMKLADWDIPAASSMVLHTIGETSKSPDPDIPEVWLEPRERAQLFGIIKTHLEKLRAPAPAPAA